MYIVMYVQWNLSIKDTLNKGHLSNEDTVCSHNHIELCINLPLIRDTSLYRTASWAPVMSLIQGPHCISLHFVDCVSVLRFEG